MSALAAVGAAVAVGASSSPAGGSIRVLDSGPATGGGGKALITGAIGDFGTSRQVTKAGKPSSNGDYVKVSLSKGTILLNVTKINAAAGKAFNSAAMNSATCSISVAFSGPATLVSGTGLYKGVSGSVHLTLNIGLILPRVTSGSHAGQCNQSNSANPIGGMQLVEGAGTVRFG